MRPEKENGVTHEVARKKRSLLYCGTGLLSSRHMCLALCTTKANSATGKRLNMACTCYAEGFLMRCGWIAERCLSPAGVINFAAVELQHNWVKAGMGDEMIMYLRFVYYRTHAFGVYVVEAPRVSRDLCAVSSDPRGGVISPVPANDSSSSGGQTEGRKTTTFKVPSRDIAIFLDCLCRAMFVVGKNSVQGPPRATLPTLLTAYAAVFFMTSRWSRLFAVTTAAFTERDSGGSRAVIFCDGGAVLVWTEAQADMRSKVDDLMKAKGWHSEIVVLTCILYWWECVSRWSSGRLGEERRKGGLSQRYCPNWRFSGRQNRVFASCLNDGTHVKNSCAAVCSIVKFLQEHRPAGSCTRFAMNGAAAAGYLDIVQGCTTEAMDAAAQNGALGVVQWLHANRTEGCTGDALFFASKHGHADVARWLLRNRQERCAPSRNIFDWVAANGHLKVIQVLHEARMDGCSARAMSWAAKNGHLDTVEWMHKHRAEGCTREAMDGAAANGHLDVVQWLHENRQEGCSIRAMNHAALNGHLEVVKWFHEVRKGTCTNNAMDNAAKNGHLEMVKFLHFNRKEGCSTDALDWAAARGHDEVVQFLLAHRKEGCTEKALDWSSHGGHNSINDSLTQKAKLRVRVANCMVAW
eukprot:jgi/Undpi1/11424/HiC_scaffold_30.g13721.m1